MVRGEVRLQSREFRGDSTRVPQGSKRFHKGPARFHGLPQRKTMCRAPVVCSEDRLAHGRNTKQNRSSWFSAHFQCFVTCSLLQAMRPEMLALLQITSRCCGTLTVQQCKCLALLRITWAWAPKALHEVSTRFCKSYGAALGKGSNKVSR